MQPASVLQHAAAPAISTLSLHDALPISRRRPRGGGPSRRSSTAPRRRRRADRRLGGRLGSCAAWEGASVSRRSEEHTSELQSLAYLVCRLLLEKKNRVS